MFFFTGLTLTPPPDDDPAANPGLFQPGWPHAVAKVPKRSEELRVGAEGWGVW